MKLKEVLRELLDEEYNYNDISKLFKVSSRTISGWCRQFGFSGDCKCQYCGITDCMKFTTSSISCFNCDVNRRNRKRKQRAIDYKGGSCIICGYDKFIGALEFHHVDPSQKTFEISKVQRSFKNIKAELDKCVLVCSNCHKELEAGLHNIEDYIK